MKNDSQENSFEFSHSEPITCFRCGCGLPREDAVCRVAQENDSDFSDKTFERRYYCPPCLLRLQEQRHKGQVRAMLVQTVGLGLLVALIATLIYEQLMGFSGKLSDLIFVLLILFPVESLFFGVVYWRSKRRRPDRLF